MKGDPAFNRCWPASKIFRELYSKEMNHYNSSNNISSVSSESCNDENHNNIYHCCQQNDIYPDYGENELESLKSLSSNDYTSSRLKLEKEVLILFSEFDEENRLPQADKGICKILNNEENSRMKLMRIIKLNLPKE